MDIDFPWPTKNIYEKSWNLRDRIDSQGFRNPFGLFKVIMETQRQMVNTKNKINHESATMAKTNCITCFSQIVNIH
jgi:hypothetical protein